MNEALRKANPSIEFEVKLLSRFPEILQELNENNNPVMVWINNVEPPDIVWHAVVVIGFNPGTNEVYYNDPWDNSEKSEDAGIFSKKWGVQSRMVKVLIGKKKQRHVDEWTLKNVDGENGE